MSCLALCQSFQFLSLFCLVAVLVEDWLERIICLSWRLCTAELFCTSTVAVLDLSNKDYLFNSHLDLEFLFHDINTGYRETLYKMDQISHLNGKSYL